MSLTSLLKLLRKKCTLKFLFDLINFKKAVTNLQTKTRERVR